MSTDGLTPGHEFLREAARSCFADRYGSPKMHVDKPLNAKLEWVPALRFTIHGHVNVFVEPSDTGPYPRILDIKYVEVTQFPQPIAVYSVCPASVIAKSQGQRDMKRLQSLGFGLVTVDDSGDATLLFPAIPLVQSTSEAEFRQRVVGLPKGIRQRVSEAFVDYRTNPVNGVKALSELVEGMVKRAAQDVAKAARATGKTTKKTPPHAPAAAVLSSLHDDLPRAQAAIGAARSFAKYYRNLSHHWPASKKAAYEKYADCRHQFLEGLRTIQAFRDAMKAAGHTGGLAAS